MTISPSFQLLKSALNGKTATATNENRDHTFEVQLFEKITQETKDGNYTVGLFDNNLDVNWNVNTSTLIMPGGDCITWHYPCRDARKGEIKFVAVDSWKKHNTISVVTEPEVGYYKMTWFYDRSYLTPTV